MRIIEYIITDKNNNSIVTRDYDEMLEYDPDEYKIELCLREISPEEIGLDKIK